MAVVKALIVVDLQNDFLAGGTLAVEQGDQIIPVINELLSRRDKFDVMLATQDWHPIDHGSFAENHPGHRAGDEINLMGLKQILWPTHCVQNSAGAELSSLLHSYKLDKVFLKGIDKNIDSYSAFFDNGHEKSTGLEEYLRAKGVTEIYLAGIATDYCVKYSVLDALKLGFKTFVITDACQGVNLHSKDSEYALQEMAAKGAKLIVKDEALGNLP